LGGFFCEVFFLGFSDYPDYPDFLDYPLAILLLLLSIFRNFGYRRSYFRSEILK
jgi:hypothetical protein